MYLSHSHSWRLTVNNLTGLETRLCGFTKQELEIVGHREDAGKNPLIDHRRKTIEIKLISSLPKFLSFSVFYKQFISTLILKLGFS
jgi:hypothetical protein